MISKKEIIFFFVLFVAGITIAWKFIDHSRKINNTPEKVAQRIINQSLQDDLCERIKFDVKKFKESPASFQRTSLSVLELESKQSLRKLLVSRGVPEDFPLEYLGDETSYKYCMTDVKAWLNIPSVGSQSLENELQAVGLKNTTTSNKNPEGFKVVSSHLNKRVALVIGNFDYKNRPLKNPKADAEDMRDFLHEANFEIIYLENASLNEMRIGFSRFNEKLKSSDVGLIYYSGHGIEHKGRNYLLPVNFNIIDEDEIPRQSLDISTIVDKVSKVERKVNIFIIDACRSSFVATKSRSITQGLQKMDGVKGTILAFSTSPGNVAEDGNGRNSPYTKHLLRSMATPGRKIEDVFKETARNVELETVGRQVPWFNSSLLVDFSIK